MNNSMTFRFQRGRDGKPVAFLDNGKVVLPDKFSSLRPKEGEWWEGTVSEREKFAIFTPSRKISPFMHGDVSARVNGGNIKFYDRIYNNSITVSLSDVSILSASLTKDTSIEQITMFGDDVDVYLDIDIMWKGRKFSMTNSFLLSEGIPAEILAKLPQEDIQKIDSFKKRGKQKDEEAEQKIKELEVSLTSLEAKIMDKEKKLQELEEKKQRFLEEHNDIIVTIEQVNATLTAKYVRNMSSDGFRRDGQVEIVHLQYSDETGTYYSDTLDTKYYNDKTVTAYLIKATEKKSGVTVGWLERDQPDRDKAEENAKELIKREIQRLQEYRELQEQARELSYEISMLKKDLAGIERQIREWKGEYEE